MLFARMCEAFGDTPPSDLVMMVLTLDAHLHDLQSNNLDSLYRTLRLRCEHFRKRLRRLLIRSGYGDFISDWVAVIEQHKSGVPHVNIVMKAPGWARALATKYVKRRCLGQGSKTARLLAGSEKHRDDFDRSIARALADCGLGWSSTAEVPRNRDAVIGYIGKVAGRADATAEKIAARLHGQSLGELSKRSQVPVRAPKGFRRTRTGVGFLPPRRKGDKTGTIVRRVYTPQGDQIVKPIAPTKNPDLQAMQRVVCELEQRLAWKDEDLRAASLARAVQALPRKERRAEQISLHRIELPPELVARRAPPSSARDGPAD